MHDDPPSDEQRIDPFSRLLGDFVRQVSEQVLTPPFAPPVAPGRAGAPRPTDPHRRRPGRVIAVVFGLVLLIAAVTLLITDGPRSGGTGTGTGAGIAGRPGQTGPTHVRVRSIEYGGSFHPAEIVGADGALWVTGERTNVGGCAVERIDPARMVPVAYGLGACGMNIVAGGGKLYLETEVSQPDSNNVSIGIESYSPKTQSSTILNTHVMTVVGSEIAHTQLAYADGSLWLYGYPDESTLIQISPSTGAVVRTITDVPLIGGTEPLIAAGPGGIWLSGGPGGAPAPAIVLSSPTASDAIRLLPAQVGDATMQWMVPVAGRMWIGGIAVTTGLHPSPSGRILVMTSSGEVTKNSRVEDFGSAPIAVGRQWWSVGPGTASCTSQPVWRVDPKTLRSSRLTTLHPPSDPCLNSGFRTVTAVGGHVFVLDGAGGSSPAVLYRLTPSHR